VNLRNVFLCAWSTSGDMSCDLLSVRENKTAQESSFQSLFCKASLLRWSDRFAQSFLCQWEGFLGFFHIFSLKGRALHCVARRWAAEVDCRGHHDPAQDGSLARPGPQLNSGSPSVLVLEK